MQLKFVGVSMRRLLLVIPIACCAFGLSLQSQGPESNSPGHFMFAWTGDLDLKGNDFLAVINADPASASYGKLVTTVVTDQPTKQIHHTEYVMPASGMLFANDHLAGRTFIFDVRNPLSPKIETSFIDMAGYMHPHSYLRLPNGHVLASFQHSHRDMIEGQMGGSGGLVEIDDQGKVIRSASSADPGFPGALLTPYSLAVLPDIDRVVSTDSSMHLDNVFSGVTYQVWRLSDLKLLKTANLDIGENHYGHVTPQEPRIGPDGAVYIQTLSCGIERISNIDSDQPTSKLVYNFPGSFCGVPTIVGHYFIQSVPVTHGLIVVDIADGNKPVEVSRVKLSDTFVPHWTGWDGTTRRVVVTGNEPRLYLLKLDQATGALTLDEAFHDADGKPGFNFANRDWPHGWRGSGLPHGVVFSR
jgi:hypothetical protein